MTIVEELYRKYCNSYANQKKSQRRRLPLRKGQFFCNEFPWLIDKEPTLFYEEDDDVASGLIRKYVRYLPQGVSDSTDFSYHSSEADEIEEALKHLPPMSDGAKVTLVREASYLDQGQVEVLLYDADYYEIPCIKAFIDGWLCRANRCVHE